MNTVERARALAEPIGRRLGLFLWDVRFEKEGALWYLRIFIDRDGGVDMNICEEFSHAYNEVLDREDFIPQNYIFEAGSPGLGRKLTRPEHFEVCTGDEIRLKLYKVREFAKERGKERVGLLIEHTETGFTIAYEIDEDGKPLDTESFDYRECASVNLNDDTDLF